eukprot:CAMPEP_0195256310 /NCGR_PEP_ID=MMETSP0706-20130129/6158_1 /TAXON_ID=33640 /ORGANISM="Asterionellopsis glacialis, Strain CCMP134" /LENGTH=168 /DNA_ID=CAMNT_0040309325 /DNA_START=80 /DNA_END=586 /DNA_ORIENTATION=-
MGMFGKKSKEQIQAMFEKDQNVGLLTPWVAMTPTSEIDKNKDYFCVATWGTMSGISSIKFVKLTSEINLAGLPKGHLVGETRQIQPGITDFRAETFTVWHERKHMAAFYKSGAHKNAMESMRDEVNFKVRRVWVKGSDIPKPGDRAATESLVLRIKSGDFPEAVKAAS